MKLRKKPIVIQAKQWTGDNFSEMEDFIEVDFMSVKDDLIIFTLEGDMTASKGDWIIRGVNGEFYPCKPDIFDKTYEGVSDDDDP